MKKNIKLLEEKNTYTVDYHEAIAYAETQQSIFWLPDEIEVEKDLHQIKTEMSEAETHGIITTLKLFTLYELVVGDDYWSEKIMKNFLRPDIQRMANCFSFFELNVHAPFYNRINEILGLNTDEFYSSYVDDPILNDRMKWIGRVVGKGDRNDPLKLAESIAIFSIIEGAILYSNFAFLKHFQSNGKNLLTNLIAGINFSVRDENVHSEAGAWLFKTMIEELELTEKQAAKMEEKIFEKAYMILEHESRIVDMIFEKGPIKGITDVQLKHFVESRIDLCLQNLGYKKLFNPKYNPIKDWFYRSINLAQSHDFFVKVGSSYNRDWVEKKFVW